MNTTTKKVLIYTGVALGSIAIGFVGYRIYSRWGKKVIKENNSTIIIDEEPIENVIEEGDTSVAMLTDYDQEWTIEEMREYFESTFEVSNDYREYFESTFV